VFLYGPAIRNAAANLISEIIGTAVLVFVVGAIFSKAIAAGDRVLRSVPGGKPGLGDWSFVGRHHRLAINRRGTSGLAWRTRYCHCGERRLGLVVRRIPVVGPLLGGVLAGWLLRILNVS